MPSHSVATNESTASCLHPRRDLRRDPGRDDEVHPALVVLRRVVVPVARAATISPTTRRDRARGCRARRTRPRRRRRTPRSSTLSSWRRASATAASSSPRRRAPSRSRPTSRAARASRTPGSRTGSSGSSPCAQRDVARDRDPAVAEHRLEEVLVHAERRRRDAGADVRHAGELEQALHRAVLAERAVQDRAARRRPAPSVAAGASSRATHGQRLRRSSRDSSLSPGSPSSQRPSRPISIDDGLVALGVERGDHRARRRERDLVLARAAAREHGDANACAHGIGVVSVVVVVVVGRLDEAADEERHDRARARPAIAADRILRDHDAVRASESSVSS